MEEKTLREVCEMLGVSRRAIQGYEKAGLLVASGKNERGYLLYDKNCQERIQQILLYRKMGFRVKEIKKLFEASEVELKKMLEKQVVKIEEEQQEMDMLIKKVCELINQVN